MDNQTAAGKSEELVAAGGGMVTAVQAMDNQTAAAGGGTVTAVQATGDHPKATEELSIAQVPGELVVGVEKNILSNPKTKATHTSRGKRSTPLNLSVRN